MPARRPRQATAPASSRSRGARRWSSPGPASNPGRSRAALPWRPRGSSAAISGRNSGGADGVSVFPFPEGVYSAAGLTSNRASNDHDNRCFVCLIRHGFDRDRAPRIGLMLIRAFVASCSGWDLFRGLHDRFAVSVSIHRGTIPRQHSSSDTADRAGQPHIEM